MEAREGHEPGGTVYVLGAGASHEGGVPLSAQILPVGLELTRALDRARARGEGEGYLAKLGDDHAAAFAKVFAFIAAVFQGRAPDGADVAAAFAALDPDEMPTLDELWALLELAYDARATFGRAAPPAQVAEVRSALMALMYHVLVGCRVTYPGGEERGGAKAALCVDYGGCDNPYGEFAKRLGPRDAVLALNYDTLLDSALTDAGRAIDYGTDVRGFRGGVARGDGAEPGAIALLKLHGSFNWLWCPTCNTMESFGDENVAHIPLESHADAARCPVEGAPREYVIVPPSLVKSYRNPHLRRVWEAAAERLRGCARAVFIGYAMADADIHVRYLVKQATAINPRLARAEGGARITAVNTSRAGLEPYVRLFGRRRVETREQTFGDFVATMGQRKA